MPLPQTIARLPARPLARAGLRFETRPVAPGVVQLRLSTHATRSIGLVSSPYLVDDLLVDTSFAHVREPLLRYLQGRRLKAVVCTHHHEDHVGNAGRIVARHRCPLYLHHPEARNEEGGEQLPAYRSFYWGIPAPYDPDPLPPSVETTIDGGGRQLHALPTPGHSATHAVLHDPASGIVFCGDLYVTSARTPATPWEDPPTLVASIRAVADLEPTLLLTGHGGVYRDPVPRLRARADGIERDIDRVRGLHARGLPPDRIREEVFGPLTARDRLVESVSGGEFSHGWFVRRVIGRL